MMRRLILCLALLAAPSAFAQERPAKELFGAATVPASGPGIAARAIGSYAKGCLAGAARLDIDGPAWQAMRLSRNRNWGHPRLITFVKTLAGKARDDGWPGLLVGDLAQPRGGPMNGGHASHQIGLDADLWLTPMPDRRLSEEERETLGARSMIAQGTREIDASVWTQAHAKLIRRAALSPEVARIFVHPGIKQALCRADLGDRSWLAKVRPWWGHDSHFHVRLKCPDGSGGCVDQAPPKGDDGCGKELAWWLSDEPWTPKVPAPPPPKPLTLADLPKACRGVLVAE